MKTAIYKAQVSAPFGLFSIAVESTDFYAKHDIMTAALAEFNCPCGMLRVKEVSKSNRRITAKMQPIKKCQTDNKYWSWIKKVAG